VTVYAQMRAKVDAQPPVDEPEPDVSEAEPCAKKSKLEQEDLLMQYNTAVNVPEAGDVRHEFDKYMTMPLSEETALQFWKTEEKKLPRMAAIAKQQLAIPATSMASERVFSLCGNTLSVVHGCSQKRWRN